MTKNNIAQLFNITRQTLNNWEKEKPELYKIINEHFSQETKKKNIDVNNPEHMIQEIVEDLKKLPPSQIKIIFYSIKMKLAEIGH